MITKNNHNKNQTAENQNPNRVAILNGLSEKANTQSNANLHNFQNPYQVSQYNLSALSYSTLPCLYHTRANNHLRNLDCSLRFFTISFICFE
jgi:hypothetical protein